MQSKIRFWMLSLILCGAGSISLMGQSHWSTEYLGTVYSQPKIKTDSLILQELDGEKYRSPLIRDIDLRLRTSELSPEVEELRMRFDLMNPAMISADKNYQTAVKNYQEIRSKMRINEYLLQKYELLIGHYHRRTLIGHHQDLQARYKQLLENSGFLPVRDVLKLDKAVFQLSREIEDLELKQAILEEELKHSLDSKELNLEWATIALVEEDQIIDELAIVLEIPMQEVELIDKRDKLLLEEFNREKQQQKRSLGFIQPEYEIDPSNDFSSNFRFQLGVQLPILNEDRVDQKYDELERLGDLSESKEDLQVLQKTINSIWLSARFFEEDLTLLQAKSEQLEQLESELATTDSDLLIDLLDYQHEVQLLKLRSRMDLMRVYIQAMSLSGALARPPLRNFLER
jgi:hypothetical protein